VTVPTGGGKRRILVRFSQEEAGRGGRAIIFTHRKQITKQTHEEMAGLGIDFGMIASGYPASLGQGTLVASVQTVTRRMRSKIPDPKTGLLIANLPSATLVLIDEAHLRIFDPIVAYYKARGVPVIGLTATPVGLKGKYDNL
jgi:superfamily II DNA or RNA helicase